MYHLVAEDRYLRANAEDRVFETGFYLMIVEEDPRNTEHNKSRRCHFVPISMLKSRADIHASYLMPNATKLRRRGLTAPWEYTCFKLIKADLKIGLKRA